MLRYLKNMSTFRFILLLLALASGCFLLLGLFRARPSNAEKRQSRRMWQALQDAENEFAEHLTLQESLGAALAVQYESPGEPMSAERFKPVMESLLATSPEFIESMGLRLGSRDDAGTHVIYRIARTSGEAAANIYPDRPLQQELELSRHIVRRNAREREVGWRLLAEPHSDAGKRFSIIFFAVLNEPRQGLAVVKANFDWLKNVLSSLVDAGIAVPLCVSPDRDVLWLDGDGLLFDRDFPAGQLPNAKLIETARKAVDPESDAGELLKSEIMGTGWHLVIAETPAGRGWGWPLWLLFLSVMGFLLDAAFNPSGGTAPPDGGPISEKPAASRLKNRLGRLLFTYRINDPGEARIESELRVARDIQFRLVPQHFPPYSEWREFDLHSLLSPAKEVAGDFYDFFMLDADRLVVAVGDVSGKGVPAALYMAVARTAFRTLARQAGHPGELLTRLNDLLVRDYPSGLYVTLACLFVDLPSGECRYALAGHPAPLWSHGDAGGVEMVDEPRETFLGLKANVTVPCGEMQLRRGDTLLLYTDGVSESRNVAGEELEYPGLLIHFSDAAGARTCEEVVESMHRAVRRHEGGGEQHDDITLLAFRYCGPGGKKMDKQCR